MAIFRKKDREKRKEHKSLQASGMASGVAGYLWSEQDDPKRAIRESYDDYRRKMDWMGALPLSFPEYEKKLRKRLKKEGIKV